MIKYIFLSLMITLQSFAADPCKEIKGDFKPLFRCHKPLNHARIFFSEFNTYRVVGGDICIATNPKRDVLLMNARFQFPCNSTVTCRSSDSDIYASSTMTAWKKDAKSYPELKVLYPGIHFIHQNQGYWWKIKKNGISIFTSYTYDTCATTASVMSRYPNECREYKTQTDFTKLQITLGSYMSGMQGKNEYNFTFEGNDVPFENKGGTSGFTCRPYTKD